MPTARRSLAVSSRRSPGFAAETPKARSFTMKLRSLAACSVRRSGLANCSSSLYHRSKREGVRRVSNAWTADLSFSISFRCRPIAAKSWSVVSLKSRTNVRSPLLTSTPIRSKFAFSKARPGRTRVSVNLQVPGPHQCPRICEPAKYASSPARRTIPRGGSMTLREAAALRRRRSEAHFVAARQNFVGARW